eukprot:TRINITY_DN24538_c0_g1_i1.p2 TRINITY_DN24538_c0_g1~~TRINITY_DN24538_c0_g1_i1.p2  ORF type:complete len:414 (+),score=125.05 TRINITY_DN24538_c0_g1_i1:225-1466(+)
MPASRLTQLLLAGSFLAASGAPAFALDTDDLMTKLQAVTEKQSNVTFTYDSVEEGSDGSVTISGMEFAPVAGAGVDGDEFKQKAPITLNLEDVQENADGSYMIGKSMASDMSFTVEDAEIAIALYTETNIHVPASADLSVLSGWGYGESTEVKDISVTFDGDKLLTIDDASSKQSFNEARTRADYLGNVTGIALDLSQLDDLKPDARATLEELGLLQTTSTFTVSGNWDLESGDFDVATYSLATENVGTLDFGMQLTGVTLETLETLQKISEIAQSEQDAPEEGAPADQENPYQAELMQLGQTIGVSGLSIRFTDDSITNRLIQTIAKEKNISTDALIAEWKGQMTAGLAGLEMPDLAASVSSAVDAYLANPQNFSVSIKPQMQMPVLAVVMAGAAAPKAIPQLLNLEIKANQ